MKDSDIKSKIHVLLFRVSWIEVISQTSFSKFELNLMHFMMVVACDDHDDAISFYFIFQWYCVNLYSMHCLFKATELTKAFFANVVLVFKVVSVAMHFAHFQSSMFFGYKNP